MLVRLAALLAPSFALREVSEELARKAEELKQSHLSLLESHKELRETQAQLIQAGKLTAIGRLASGVAHELNNPLQAVSGNANFLAQDIEKLRPLPPELEGFPRFIERIQTGAERSRVIVQGMLGFARHSGTEKSTLDLSEVADAAVDMLRTKVRHQRTELKTEWERGTSCVGNRTQLSQVVVNLVLNAAQALGEGGTITVTTAASGGKVTLSVSDTGPGIPADVRARIFEPFFTTKSAGEGTGLGLSISESIVKSFGGGLLVECPPTGGTTFTMELPKAPSARESAYPPRTRVAAPVRAPHCRGSHMSTPWQTRRRRTRPWRRGCRHG